MDGSTGCLWSRAVSHFSPLKIILNHSATCPIYTDVQVVCARAQVCSAGVFDGDGLRGKTVKCVCVCVHSCVL